MPGDLLLAIMFGAKLALYGSVLIASGLGLHVVLGIIDHAGLGAAMRGFVIASIAALAAAMLRLVLLNAQLAGNLGGALDTASFAWIWQAHGPAFLTLAVGAALAAVAAALQARWLAGLAAIAMCASFALTGHVQALEPRGPAPLIVALHVGIAAFWAAAPVSLWPNDGIGDASLVKRLQRFSDGAVIVVPVLFAAGVWLAWRLAGGFTAVFASDYGRLLLLKLAVAAAALALGALNKRFVSVMLRTAPTHGRRWLKCTLTADTGLFALALILIAFATTFTGPPAM